MDAFVGTGALPGDRARCSTTRSPGRGRGVYVEAGRTHLYDDASPRLLIGPGHSAYVKIAEGCDRVCAFCAIPGIRGRFQSRRLDSLVRRGARSSPRPACARSTSSRRTRPRGARTCARAGRPPKLADLLRALDAVDGLDWIRLLYVYPSAVTDELIDALARREARAALRGRAAPARERPRCSRDEARHHAPRASAALVARLRERDPGPHAAHHLHRGLPRRDRRRLRGSCSTSCASRASTASASSATRTRRAPPRFELAEQGAARASRASATGGSRRSRRGIHGREARARRSGSEARRAGGRRDRRAAARAAASRARRPRSTASCSCAAPALRAGRARAARASPA